MLRSWALSKIVVLLLLFSATDGKRRCIAPRSRVSRVPAGLVRQLFRSKPHATDARAGKLTERQEVLVNWTAEEAIEHLCTGRVSAVEYSEALLAQNKLTACLNNFAALEPQQVQQVVPPPDFAGELGKTFPKYVAAAVLCLVGQ